jgi:thymidylate synthase (FAD)
MSEATVRLICRPAFDASEAQAFLDDWGMTWIRTPNSSSAEELVEFSGRVCYMSFGEGRQSPRTNLEYINNLIKQLHESVLEHATWSFIITGISRGFTHQLVRHRIGFSFSQLSQQYYEDESSPFIKPDLISSDPDTNRIWEAAVLGAREAYSELLSKLKCLAGQGNKEAKRALRTAARSVLPEAAATSIAVTANCRAIRHFLDIRGAIEGDEEMRKVSAALLSLLQQDSPSLFSDFEVRRHTDGSPIVVRTGSAD